MSHYITADLGSEDKEVYVQCSSSSIHSIYDTGFDIFEMYERNDLDNPDSTIINFKTAEYAYLNAVAWVLSLQRSFPEKFEEMSKEKKEYGFPIDEILFENLFDEEILNEIIIDNCKYHPDASEKTVDTSFYFLSVVLNFSYKIYEYTKLGNKLEITFV